jgi:hypothetical protein
MDRLPAGHPGLTAAAGMGISPSSRHVVLPFNRSKDRGAFRGENLTVLKNLFLDTNEVSFDSYSLVFCVNTLPPKPWPVTVAGVPPYFTTDPDDIGPNAPFIKRTSSSSIHVAQGRGCSLP